MYIHVHTCIYMTYMYVQVYTCMYTYPYIHIYIHIYAYTHIYMYSYAHMYIHVHTCKSYIDTQHTQTITYTEHAYTYIHNTCIRHIACTKCIYMYLCSCMHICIYVYVCVTAYTYIDNYIYIRTYMIHFLTYMYIHKFYSSELQTTVWTLKLTCSETIIKCRDTFKKTGNTG